MSKMEADGRPHRHVPLLSANNRELELQKALALSRQYKIGKTIQIVGSEFGINIMKTQIHPA